MRLAGYVLERGMDPATVFGMTRQDRLIYQAMMELNQQQGMQVLTAAVHNALIMFWNELHGEGE